MAGPFKKAIATPTVISPSRWPYDFSTLDRGQIGVALGGQPGIPVNPDFLDARKAVMTTFGIPNVKTVAGTGLTCYCSRMYTRFYTKTVLWFQLVYFTTGLVNDYSDPNAPVGEFPNINDVVISASVQNVANSNWVKATFNGQPTYRATTTSQQTDPVTGKLLPVGVVMSDPIFISTTAVVDGSGGLGFSTSATNGAVKVKTRVTVDHDTDQAITGWISGDSQDQVYRMSAANEADQVWAIGDFVAGSGDVTSLATIAPVAIIGCYKNNDGLLATAFFGDSIGSYFNDNRPGIRTHSAGAPNGGMFFSALRTLGLPMANYCLPSSSPIGYTGVRTVRDFIRRFFHVNWEQGGHNAVSAGSSAANILTWNESANYTAKQSGVLHTVGSTIIPDATSSDGFVTQAARPDFGAGGIKQTYNINLKARGGNPLSFDTVVDLNAEMCAANDDTIWGSPDFINDGANPQGIHPTKTLVVGTLGGGHRKMRDNRVIPYFQSLPTPTFTTP